MELMALIEDILIQREIEKEWVSLYGIMDISYMQSNIRVNFMVLLGASGQMEKATGVSSNMDTDMDMAHIIMVKMERHSLGSENMIRKMAMVFLHSLMEQLIKDSVKMINQKDMDSKSTRMAISMTASGKMTRNQEWESIIKQQQVSFKDSIGKMASASKL